MVPSVNSKNPQAERRSNLLKSFFSPSDRAAALGRTDRIKRLQNKYSTCVLMSENWRLSFFNVIRPSSVNLFAKYLNISLEMRYNFFQFLRGQIK